METWEIILLIFIIFLVVAGGLVGAYFLWRSQQKKPTNGNGNGSGIGSNPPNNNTPTIPNNPNNGNGGSSDNPNPPNTNPIPPDSFAVKQLVNNNVSVWTVKQATNVTAPFFIEVVPSQSNIPCKNYLFTLTANGELVWQGDGESVVGADPKDGGPVFVGKPNQLPSNFTTNWSYNNSNKTWCTQSDPTLCLQRQGPRPGFFTSLLLKKVTTDNSFKFDRVSSIPNTNITCSK